MNTHDQIVYNLSKLIARFDLHYKVSMKLSGFAEASYFYLIFSFYLSIIECITCKYDLDYEHKDVYDEDADEDGHAGDGGGQDDLVLGEVHDHS